MTITAETYTTANGSNMDAIAYDGSTTIYDIADDLRNSYNDWDYAILTDDDGDEIATVEREHTITIKDHVSGANTTVNVAAYTTIDEGTFIYAAYTAKASAEVDCQFAIIETADGMVCQSDWQAVSATPDSIADYEWDDCTPNNEEAESVSITEAAELLGVSRQRVHVLLQNGQLEGRKVGNTWSVSRQSVENRMSR